MTVSVIRANGNDCRRGMDGFEKRIGAARRASVMADFEHISVQLRACVIEKPHFLRRFRIAYEK
jgi:hypothetical protein